MLTNRLRKRAVDNASVANLGIEPGDGQINSHAIHHHRPQQSACASGQVGQQQAHRGRRQLRRAGGQAATNRAGMDGIRAMDTVVSLAKEQGRVEGTD